MIDLLLAMCFKTGKSSDIKIVLEYADRHGLKFREGHMNSLIVNLAKLGSYTKVLEIWRNMEESSEKVRLTTLCAILVVAANERDFPIMLKLAKQLKMKALAHYRHTHVSMTNTIKNVLITCKGMEDSVAMEATFELLDILRITRQKLSQEMAYVIGEWVNRYSALRFMCENYRLFFLLFFSSKQFSLQETIVNYRYVLIKKSY